jgi:hypothetical protein
MQNVRLKSHIIKDYEEMMLVTVPRQSKEDRDGSPPTRGGIRGKSIPESTKSNKKFDLSLKTPKIRKLERST